MYINKHRTLGNRQAQTLYVPRTQHKYCTQIVEERGLQNRLEKNRYSIEDELS